jgi:hypothetical protein
MTNDTTVYSYGYTDSLGAIKLEVVLPETGHVRLVATGVNLYPYDTVIPIAVTAVAEPVVPRPGPAAAGLQAVPSVFGSRVALRWQTGLGTPGHIEICDATGNVVRRLTCAGRESAVWDGRNDNGTAAPAGVYLCSMVSAAGRTSGTTRVVKLD